MINNFLHGGAINGSSLLGNENEQKQINETLLAICIVCVPLMLFVKPWILNKRNQSIKGANNHQSIKGYESLNQVEREHKRRNNW